jgi:hypothetical protein
MVFLTIGFARAFLRNASNYPCTQSTSSKPADYQCVVCPFKSGALKPVGDKWVHVACVLWLPEVRYNDPEPMTYVADLHKIHPDRICLSPMVEVMITPRFSGTDFSSRELRNLAIFLVVVIADALTVNLAPPGGRAWRYTDRPPSVVPSNPLAYPGTQVVYLPQRGCPVTIAVSLVDLLR